MDHKHPMRFELSEGKQHKMSPTEKRLREALAVISEMEGEEGIDDHEFAERALTIANTALAAIPSETGGEDAVGRLKEMRGDVLNSDWWNTLDAAITRIESLQAQLASLRGRIVEECAKVINDYCKTYNVDSSDLEECAERIRALAKSPPVSGKKDEC